MADGTSKSVVVRERFGAGERTAMVAGEVLLPGASDLIAGNVGAGVGTFLATGLAVAVLAPTAPLLALLAGIGLRVNSYARATSGSSLLMDMSSRFSPSPRGEPQAASPEKPAART